MYFNLDYLRISELGPPHGRRRREKQQHSIGSRGEPPSIHAPNYTSQMASLIPNQMYQAALKQCFQLALTNMFESGTLEQLMNETICRVNTLEVMCPGTYTFDNVDIITMDGEKQRTSVKAVPSSLRRRQRRSFAYHQISSTEILIGKIWIRKTNISFESSATPFTGSSESITTSIFYPASWLMRMGVNYGVEASFRPSVHGCRFDFTTVHAVPDDSLVFDLCGRGDLIGVRRLLERCDASVYDRNSKGWTPLHVSTFYG